LGVTNLGIQDIYAYSKNFQKSKVYNAMVHRAPNTLTLIDKKGHGRKRRIISQGFSDSALRGYEPVIMNHVEKLCTQLSNASQVSGKEFDSLPGTGNWSSAQNMAKWCMYPS